MRTVKARPGWGVFIGLIVVVIAAAVAGCATAPGTPSSSSAGASEKQKQASNKGQAAKGQFSQGASKSSPSESSVRPARGQKPLETATAENVSPPAPPEPTPAAAVPASQTKGAERRAAKQKAAEQRLAEQKAAEEKAAEEKAAKQKAVEQKAAERKAAEQKPAEQKVAERKAAEQRLAEQKAAEQKLAEQKAAEKAEKAEKKLAEKERSRRTDSSEDKAAQCAVAPQTPAAPQEAGPQSASPKDFKGTETSIGSSVTIPTSMLQGEPQAADPAAPIKATLSMPTTLSAEDYRIGPGDVLAFHSFDDPALDAPVVVRYDGFVSLPLIKDINISGMTRGEATAALTEAYKEFFKNPDLSLSVTEAKSRQYWVMGEVNQPSPYPYVQPVTLLEAINMAGGLRVNVRSGESYTGSQGQLIKAFVFRRVNNQRVTYDFDLTQLKRSGPHVADTLLMPGDIVYVPESLNVVYVLGEVRMPNAYPLTEEMTLMQLLARAGGFNESTGRLQDVALLHQVDDTNTQVSIYDIRKILKSGGDVKINPGDIVYVSRKKLAKAQEFATRLTGSVLPYLQLQQQVISLYTQAYEAYYTKERYDRLFNDKTNNALSFDQTVQDLAAIRTIIQPSTK